MRQSKFPLHFVSTGKLLVIEVAYLFVDIFIYLFVCVSIHYSIQYGWF